MASTPMLGAIFIFAGNFAPRGYALCQGQLMSIAQNTALFSILGTTYGGDGVTTFALPDLRGRGPVGTGSGPGLSPVIEGEASGSQSVTILSSNMPIHNHMMSVNNQPGSATDPTGGIPAVINDGGIPVPTVYQGFSTANPTGTLKPTAITMAGGSQPMSILNPYLGINFIIATEGIFPSRG